MWGLSEIFHLLVALGCLHSLLMEGEQLQNFQAACYGGLWRGFQHVCALGEMSLDLQIMWLSASNGVSLCVFSAIPKLVTSCCCLLFCSFCCLSPVQVWQAVQVFVLVLTWSYYKAITLILLFWLLIKSVTKYYRT